MVFIEVTFSMIIRVSRMIIWVIIWVSMIIWVIAMTFSMVIWVSRITIWVVAILIQVLIWARMNEWEIIGSPQDDQLGY